MSWYAPSQSEQVWWAIGDAQSPWAATTGPQLSGVLGARDIYLHSVLQVVSVQQMINQLFQKRDEILKC